MVLRGDGFFRYHDVVVRPTIETYEQSPRLNGVVVYVRRRADTIVDVNTLVPSDFDDAETARGLDTVRTMLAEWDPAEHFAEPERADTDFARITEFSVGYQSAESTWGPGFRFGEPVGSIKLAPDDFRNIALRSLT